MLRGIALSRHRDRFQQVLIICLSRVSCVRFWFVLRDGCNIGVILRRCVRFTPLDCGGWPFPRSHHNALSDHRLPFGGFGAAVVAFVLLLGPLNLALFHLTFVKVKSNHGYKYDSNDQCDEHEQHGGGWKRLEKLIHLLDAGAIGLGSPVEGAVWYGKRQILGCPGTHWARFSQIKYVFREWQGGCCEYNLHQSVCPKTAILRPFLRCVRVSASRRNHPKKEPIENRKLDRAIQTVRKCASPLTCLTLRSWHAFESCKSSLTPSIKGVRWITIASLQQGVGRCTAKKKKKTFRDSILFLPTMSYTSVLWTVARAQGGTSEGHFAGFEVVPWTVGCGGWGGSTGGYCFIRCVCVRLHGPLANTIEKWNMVHVPSLLTAAFH